LRIYSFLPAATEIIFALGLGDQVSGVTRECDFPPEARKKRIVVDSFLDPSTMPQGDIDHHVVESMSHGHGLYRIDRGLLAEQRPDIIVTQELCDVCSVSLRDVLGTVSELSESCRVISLTPRGLSAVLEDIMTVGRACGVEERAARLVALLSSRVKAVTDRTKTLSRKSVFCVEWFDPIFASGHWVPEIVRLAGGVDELGLEGKNSRKIAWQAVRDYDPEVLVLIPCGFDLRRTKSDIPILQKLPGWEELRAVEAGRVYVADGSSYYSRPGPRLVDGLEMMASIVHPEVFGEVFPPGRAERIGPAALVSNEHQRHL
jgi:iron complex transport system substrate-binding protein